MVFFLQSTLNNYYLEMTFILLYEWSNEFLDK